MPEFAAKQMIINQKSESVFNKLLLYTYNQIDLPIANHLQMQMHQNKINF